MSNKNYIIIKRIKEFIELWHNYSAIYAWYNILWWFCFYTRPSFCYKLSTYAIKKKTAWLDKYIEKKYKDITNKYNEGDNTLNLKAITNQPNIWVFWGQGEEAMPQLVRACYKQLTTYNSNVQLITNANINQYIDLPPIILEKVYKKNLSWAYYSDIVRNTILAKYGGLWLDATVWVPCRIPIEDFMKYKFFSPSDIYTTNNRTIRFWSNIEWNWNAWCLWSNSINFPLFAYVSNMLIEIGIKEPIIPDYVTIDYLIYSAIRKFPATQEHIEKAKEIKSDKRHRLATIMNEEYNEKKYLELTKNNYFFKLSFRAKWHERTTEGKPTFYGRLICNI